MTEANIMHQAGDYWVARERVAYTVYKPYGACASITDSSYRKDADGLSIAIARCNYLAKRNNERQSIGGSQ